MNQLFRILAFLVIPFLLINCMNQENPAEEQLKKDKEAITKYATENNLQGSYIFNDIYKVQVTPSSNFAMPSQNSGVRLKYRMSLLDGSVIDSSSVFYQQGQGFFIPGWEAGVSTMVKNEVATFLIPSYYAYGSSSAQKGTATIPPNSVIKLDAELVDITAQSDVPMAYAYYNNLKGKLSSSGVFYSVTDSTTQGANPVKDQTVTLKYRGYFLNGYTFDKNESFSFVLGTNTIIPGFNEVIPLLKVGEKATVIIPSNMAYGEQPKTNNGVTIIPANATLVFDLEILDAK